MNVLRIENGRVAIEIAPKQGKIVSLCGNGRDLCQGNTYPLFVLSIIRENYENEKISAFDFAFENEEIIENGCRLTYAYQGEFTVELCITRGENEEFRFRAMVKNHTKDLIEWLEYPGVSWQDDLDGSKKSQILWIFNEGALVSYPKDKMWPYEDPCYPSWGTFGVFPNMVQSQFLAYMYDGGGLYVGCHDTNKNVKQIDFYHKDERVKLQLRYYSGAEYGADFAVDFDTVFRFFEGEWQDACDIYRAWYERVSDVKKLCENEDLPVWYAESPLVVALPVRGAHDTGAMTESKLYPYDNLLAEVERIAEKTKSKLMILLMHWEGTAPWSPPYVWPPYGGEENFRAFSDKLHAMGHYLGLYCSGFAWTQQSNVVPEYNKEQEFAEKNLQAEMCVGPDQRLEYRTVCTPQARGYDFCPTSKFLKDVIAREVENMLGAGVDYIQLLDQNHGGGSYFCYSKSHGHPPVPGSWQVDEVNSILEDVYQDKKIFGCESAAAEPFIKNLLFSDNRWTLAELVGDAVPAYAYIYHSRVNNFMGNQTCCEFRFHEDDYRYRLTYSFLAGDMLTIVINEDGEIMHHWGAARKNIPLPEQSSTFALIKEYNGWRVAAKDYLCYGDMAKPLPYVCDETCTFTVFRRQEFEKKMQKVLSNAFRFNGKQVDFFANYTREEVEIELPIADGERVYLSSAEFAAGKHVARKTTRIVIPPLHVIAVERDV